MRLKSNDDDDGGFRARGPQLSGKEDGGKSKWLGQVKGVWAEGKGPSLWRWARNQEGEMSKEGPKITWAFFKGRVRVGCQTLNGKGLQVETCVEPKRPSIFGSKIGQGSFSHNQNVLPHLVKNELSRSSNARLMGLLCGVMESERGITTPPNDDGLSSPLASKMLKSIALRRGGRGSRRKLRVSTGGEGGA